MAHPQTIGLTAETVSQRDDVRDDGLEVTFIGEDRSLAELYRIKLELDGYSVTHAPTLASGLEQLHRRPPDLAYLDVGLDGMACLNALAVLRRDPALDGLPVVVLLRSGRYGAAIQQLQLGARDFVVKADPIAGPEIWSVHAGTALRAAVITASPKIL